MVDLTLGGILPGTDADILGRTLDGEARGEGRPGREDVACVVINRLAIARRFDADHPVKPYWWGGSVGEICLHRFGFSCWNAGDPNRARLLALADSDPVFADCLITARRAIAGGLIDQTRGATHYKVTALPWPHDWGAPVAPVFVYGHHSFYIIH